MSAKTVTLECSDCGEKFSLVSKVPETVAYCPFCGTSIGVPTEDVDGDDYADEDEEEEDDDE